MKYEVKIKGEKLFEAQYVTIGDHWVAVRRGPREDKYYYPSRRVSYVVEIRTDPANEVRPVIRETLEALE